MKKNKTIPFVKGFILIFLLVVFPAWSLLLGQEVKKYPLYPDIWIREFMDYLDDQFLFIYPIGENEVLVSQPSKVDQYGETVTDAKGNSISLMEKLLFFSGRSNRKTRSWRAPQKMGARLAT